MPNIKPYAVSICGIGNFGYAILKHLDRKRGTDFTLTAYDYDKDVVNHLQTKGKHPYIQKSVSISDNITFVSTPEELLSGCDVLILAVSSDATKEVMRNIRAHANKPLIIVNTAKALDKETGKRLSEIAADELADLDYSYALLAGGTIASNLFEHEPLGIDIASRDTKALNTLQPLFESNNLHVYTTQDLTGVEYAAAFKNVISILAGIVKGLGFSYGAETHAISKTAQMIADACTEKLGASANTFTIGRQCWGNDMWMSCTGKTRNREFGILLGGGMPVGEALEEMHSGHKLVEGVNTLKVLNNIEGIKDIKTIGLLHDLIIKQSVDVEAIKNYLLRTHLY